MYLQPSGSGSKYQGRNETLWEHGEEARIRWGYGSAEMRCTKSGPAQGVIGATADNSLADTRWRLVEFQSMDDAIGIVRPHDPALYTMHLESDGTVTMRLNCNRTAAHPSLAQLPSQNVGKRAHLMR